MEYTEFDIRLNEVNSYADIVVARLNEIEFESYSEVEGGIRAYVQTQLLDTDAAKEILSEISKLTKVSFTINKVEQRNWNAEWESNYSPVVINDSCVIRAHFHNNFPALKYEIIITPKMSFGTGHHQTTLLMVNEMFNLDLKDKFILDMGSGTGVLAILASKLGARHLIAIDSDEWAFKNAKENSQLNNISNINFIHGDINDIGHTKFDVVLANISRNVILNDIEIYVDQMKDDGEILLSGFLKEDIPLILEKTGQLGLELVVVKNKDKWQMLHLRRA
ncbi:MAG: 50S ribosomal protein L11 methyltransferase [Flavobacteriales bacterium]|nr:50S ribosomal protein L11 methyltransferase [Flavobacteriales bacterium]|tara:strand:- start:326 stop:1159 length:834 start_codon:yes stop_codon:yes gene_type:complete